MEAPVHLETRKSDIFTPNWQCRRRAAMRHRVSKVVHPRQWQRPHHKDSLFRCHACLSVSVHSSVCRFVCLSVCFVFCTFFHSNHRKRLPFLDTSVAHQKLVYCISVCGVFYGFQVSRQLHLINNLIFWEADNTQQIQANCCYRVKLTKACHVNRFMSGIYCLVRWHKSRNQWTSSGNPRCYLCPTQWWRTNSPPAPAALQWVASWWWLKPVDIHHYCHSLWSQPLYLHPPGKRMSQNCVHLAVWLWIWIKIISAKYDED